MGIPEKAYISVADKAGVVDFTAEIYELGCREIYVSGSAAEMLHEANIPVNDISGFADKETNEVQASLVVPVVDMLVVDMNPPEKVLGQGLLKEEILKRTELEKLTMLLAGAKARKLVLSHPEQRPAVVRWMRDGMPDEEEKIGDLAFAAHLAALAYQMKTVTYIGELVVAEEASDEHSQALRQIALAGDGGWIWRQYMDIRNP
jgi:AICAR transformylase/IMP cyclohydrolase PurH